MKSRALIVALILAMAAFGARYLNAQTMTLSGGVASAVNGGGGGAPSLFPDGSLAAPSIAFANQPQFGWFRGGTQVMALTNGAGSAIKIWMNNTGINQPNGFHMGWTSSNTDASLTPDIGLGRPGVASAIQVNGLNNTGTATLVLNRLVATGSSPSCLDNCGPASSSVVVGTDAAWRLTIGTVSATPQNTFAILFRTAWTGAPNCVAQLAQVTGAGQVASVASTNSTATGVTVNLVAAPSNGQVYHGQCVGMTLGS